MDPLLINVENAGAWLHYNHEYQVLFCQHHQYGIRNLKTHLRDYHAGSVAEKKVVVQQYEHLTIAPPAQVKTPPHLVLPFPELGKPRRAFQCAEEGCLFISINRTVIRQHCHGHQWRHSKTNPTHWQPVWVQCFFPSGGFQRYFVVDYRDADEEPVFSTTDEHTAILNEWRAYLQSQEAAKDVVSEPVAKQDKTLWWKRTGWQEHLHQCNLRHLSAASRLPRPEEIELQQLRAITHALIETCVSGLRTLDIELRRWLRSAQRSEPDVRPLSRLQNEETQKRYADYIVRFVCYSLRVSRSIDEELLRVRDSEAASEDGQQASNDDGRAAALFVFDTMKAARRLYPWHGEQGALAFELWHMLRTGSGEAAQTRALHRFLQAVTYQSVRGDGFCSPLLHFLAVLSIDDEMGRLREAQDFSYMLAGIVYCVRVLFAEDVLPSACRNEQGPADDARFLDMRAKHLADGSLTPMSRMLSLLAYGKKIGLNHQNEGSSFWDGDSAVIFHGRRIVMSHFRAMLDAVVASAETLLWEELLWSSLPARFTIPLDDLVDNVTFSRRGFSFLDDPANRLQHTDTCMLEKMAGHPTGRQMLRDGQWQSRPLRNYLRAVDRFRELLLFCVHLTGGQPGRGTEVTAIRFCNGFGQDRNIFVIRGQMVIVTRYHKSASQLDKPKVIPRFLPWRVGQLLVVYLAYVQKFAALLRKQTGETIVSEHLWESEHGVWETDRLTRVLQQQTAEHLGTSLSTLEYRHLAIFIGRKVVGEGFAQGFREESTGAEEVDEDDALEMSAGRGGETGANRYGVAMDIVKNLSSRSMEVFRPLSEGWHTFLGLESSGPARKRRHEETEEIRNAELTSPAGPRGIWTQDAKRQCGPSGRLATPSSSSAPRWSDYFRDGVDMDVRRAVGEAELTQALQKVVGSETAEFRSAEQRDALLAVVNGKNRTPLVVVLPTGGGKSALFMAPACLDDPGVTVVVVPFRALLDDLLAKARAVGIESVEWLHGSTLPATLVFVSADKVSGTGFAGHMKLWEQHGVLRRIFLDEAHLAFKDNHWRVKLAGLRELRDSQCPLIMLTATLPPALEPELETCMVAAYARYIRGPTTRARTRYIVEQVRPGTLRTRALKLCRRVQARLGRDRGVVYCRSRAECQEMAEELGCMLYRGQDVENPERLAHWLANNGLIVATSALGMGVDFDRVVFTLHVDMPYGMLDFAQESGRGGRAGEEVDALVLCEEGAAERALQRARTTDELAMANFVRTQGCRRKVQSLFLDGREVSCGVALARCDGCGEGITALQRQSKREAWERGVFELTMGRLTDFCSVCWWAGEHWEHAAVTCRHAHPIAAVEAFRSQLRFRPDTHSCFKCGLSQKLCRTGVDDTQVCQWPGRAAPLLYALLQQEDGYDLLRACGYDGKADLREGMAWLVQRHPRRIWNEVMSNAMTVLVRGVIDAHESGRSRGLRRRMSSPVVPAGIVEENADKVQSEQAEGAGHGSVVVHEVSASKIRAGKTDNQAAAQDEDAASEGSTDYGDTDYANGDYADGDYADGAAPSRLPVAATRWPERESLQVGALKQLLAWWENRCSICLMHPRDDTGHKSWRSCPDVTQRQEVEARSAELGRIRYRYSACFACHAPQEVCRSWRKVGRSGNWRFRRDKTVPCQFPTAMRDVGAAVLSVRADGRVQQWLQKQMAEDGGECAGNKGAASAQSIQEWFGRKFVVGGIEVSGLCRLVWQFGPDKMASNEREH